MRRRRHTEGFSLVEMLVVMMIVTLLATLIFVGIGKLTQKANLTVCQNNLRQLASSTLEYANFVNDGRFPGFDFQVSGNMATTRCAEEWIWALKYVDTLYYAHSTLTKILPPRDSHPVLRCPSDTYYIANAQKALTSYFAVPLLTDQVVSTLTRQNESPLFFEGDPINLTGNCGCRFHYQEMPSVAANYHDGGSNAAFLNGSVRWIGAAPGELKVANYYLYKTNGMRRVYPMPGTWDAKGQWTDD